MADQKIFMRANVNKNIDICAAETVKNAKRTSAGLNQSDLTTWGITNKFFPMCLVSPSC